MIPSGYAHEACFVGQVGGKSFHLRLTGEAVFGSIDFHDIKA